MAAQYLSRNPAPPLAALNLDLHQEHLAPLAGDGSEFREVLVGAPQPWLLLQVIERDLYIPFAHFCRLPWRWAIGLLPHALVRAQLFKGVSMRQRLLASAFFYFHVAQICICAHYKSSYM